MVAKNFNPSRPHFEFATQEVYYKPTSDHTVWNLDGVRNYRPPSVHELPSSFADVRRLSLDFETKDPEIKSLGPGVRRDGNYVAGVAIAIEDGPDMYLPVRHHGGDNCDWNVMEWVRDRFKELRPGTVLTGAYLPYDLDWGMENGIDFSRLSIKDTQVVDPLIYEFYHSYSLESLCERYGLPGKDEVILRQAAEAFRIDPKKELWKLPARFVHQYGRTDARRPLQVLRRQEKKAAEEGVEAIIAMEMKVTPILVKMRRRGIPIDMDKLDMIERKASVIQQEMCDKIKHATGVCIDPKNLFQTAAIAPALKVMGYKLKSTDDDHESVDKSLLSQCGEIGKWIRRAREWRKLVTTFAMQVRKFSIRGSDGVYRAHVTFNQLKATDPLNSNKGVRYGRLSSSEFNIQYQPVRNPEFGKLWRSIYIAEKGKKRAASDWSQQEPRIAVHYAELIEKLTKGKKCRGAREFADKYRADPSLDIHQALTDIANDPENLSRTVVKNFVNGRLYGMGDLKLCKAINCATTRREIYGKLRDVPGPEGQAKIDMFNKFAPWIRDLVGFAADVMEKEGHVWTAAGRKCHAMPHEEGSHKAFSRIGQGGAADQMKETLIACDSEDIPIDMAVHDEFGFSFDDLNQAKRVRELQMTVRKFNVPMKVDLEIGDNWGEMELVA